MSKKGKSWTPPSDEELQVAIERAISGYVEPRPLSLVRFSDNSMFRRTYLTQEGGLSILGQTQYNEVDYSRLLYLGPVANQSGHGVYINLTTQTTHVIDIEELVELTEDEL